MSTIHFETGDPKNPVNWPSWKKIYCMSVGLLLTFNGVLGSSLPAGAISALQIHFQVKSQTQLVLALSAYQFGFVFGSLIFAPLSEFYGRKIVFVSTISLYALFNLASALAPSWSTFVCFRWICGIGASSTISVTGGLNADLFDVPLTRGRANALFIVVTTAGPQFAPLVSSYASEVDWRWPFWIALIAAGASLVPLLLMPETHAAVILKRLAKNDIENQDIAEPKGFELMKHILVVFVARPLRMMFTESMVTLTCLYLGFATGIYYLFFQAYPIVFKGLYGLGIGPSGLTYLPIILGILLGFAAFMYYDRYLRQAVTAKRPWIQIEEYLRLPLACIGGPCLVVSLFWLGWASNEQISYVVPMFAGVPFGFGFFLILMSLTNYLADAYKTSSASALAAVSCARSLGAALLPFAAGPMYHQLGVHWGTSLLAFLSLGMVAIPFLLIHLGNRIREGSRFCRELALSQPEAVSRARATRSEAGD